MCRLPVTPGTFRGRSQLMCAGQVSLNLTAWLIVLVVRGVSVCPQSVLVSMANEPASSKTPVELRAQAHHARELARALLPGDETARRLRMFADELEAEATALERQIPLTRGQNG
jgi:hypothetical protein